MPSYRRTHRRKKYILANGNPKTVNEGREATQRTMTVRYVPGQNLRTGIHWDRQTWAPGTNWLTELRRLETLGEDGAPLEVTIGDVDYGLWFIDVRTTPEPENHVKNPAEGTIAPLITTAEITFSEVDATRTRLTNNAPGISV